MAVSTSPIASIAAALRERRAEIEATVLARVLTIDETKPRVSEYTSGLRAAVCAAIDYALAAIELGEERSPPPPPALLAQARLAARNGVSLDTVLRRYFAGHSLLVDFVVEEAGRSPLLSTAVLRRPLRGQLVLFDRLLAAVSEEYTRAARSGPASSPTARRTQRIERLLAGERLDIAGLAYDFEATHVGVIAHGSGAHESLIALAGELDQRLLALERPDGVLWAWLGSRGRAPASAQRHLNRRLVAALSEQLCVGIGEPAGGLAGWLLTHRQADAALQVALHTGRSQAHYADVGLLAHAINDRLLATSLRQLYLVPLEGGPDGGVTAIETLRAYFQAERNTSAAARALGVSRQAVENRLRGVEERLECALSTHALEIEMVLEFATTPDSDRPQHISPQTDHIAIHTVSGR